MNRSHHSKFRVRQQHGQAIGGCYRKQNTCLIGQQRITSRLGEARLFGHSASAQPVLEFTTGGPPNLIHVGGMDLPERRQHEVFRAKLLQEELPIFPHSGAWLALGESEVQPRRWAAAHPTSAGAESMD
jgi:hypothetical protein